MNGRRFPPPWSIDELEVCFVVRDHSGQALAYVSFEDAAGDRVAAHQRHHRPERHRPAALAAKLSDDGVTAAGLMPMTLPSWFLIWPNS